MSKSKQPASFEERMAATPPGPIKTSLREVTDAATMIGAWMIYTGLKGDAADVARLTDLVLQHAETVRVRGPEDGK